MLYIHISIATCPKRGVSILIKNFIAPIIVGIIVGAINNLFSYYLNNKKTIKQHLHNKYLHK